MKAALESVGVARGKTQCPVQYEGRTIAACIAMVCANRNFIWFILNLF